MPGTDRGGRTDTRQRRAFQRLSQDPLAALGITAGNGIQFGPGDSISIKLDPVADNLLSLSASGLNGQSPLTTKGDIWTWSSTNARLAVGANEKVLVADSAETTGLKYADRERVLFTTDEDSSTIANATVGTTETDFSQSYDLPANTLLDTTGANTILRVVMDFTLVGAALNSTRMRFKMGGTTVYDTGTINHTSTSSVQVRRILYILCRTAGGSGQVAVHVMEDLNPNTGSPFRLPRTLTTVDTTSTLALVSSVQWSNASTSTATQTLFTVEKLN